MSEGGKNIAGKAMIRIFSEDIDSKWMLISAESCHLISITFSGVKFNDPEQELCFISSLANAGRASRERIASASGRKEQL